MRELIPDRIYQHYKGNFYKIICTAKHSETLEELVVYQCLYGDYGFWVRPSTMFLETVVVDGNEVGRFALVEPALEQSE